MNLRDMTMDDADKMLEFKNYSETRAFSILSHEEIKREDHLAWLPKHLHEFQIIQDTQILGAIRIQEEMNDGVEYSEVSIWIDREHRGKGVASYILKKIAKPGMFARIVDGNVCSMRAFLAAGFKPTRHYDNYYILVR